MIECCLTIDFEDWSYNTLRNIGATPRAREGALHKAYDRLMDFLAERGCRKALTFFTTGQVARDCPRIVRRIAEDGHEIACHGFHHDHVSEKDRASFAAELDLAIRVLGDASGQRIRGYRAPMFSMRPFDEWAYEEIAARFDYDASLVTARRYRGSGPADELRFGGRTLREFPFCSVRVWGGVPIPVLGGTYLKVMSARTAIDLVRESARRGFLPMVYLHPYELLYEGELALGWHELHNLSTVKRIYWQVRQHQWISVGNAGLLPKLRALLAEVPPVGRICDLPDAAKAPVSEEPSRLTYNLPAA